MGCRKNLTRLTLAEKQAFINAVLTLKANGGYDQYVAQHGGAMSHGHQGPAFFPWHREFIRRFERDLQAIDASVNLPYWDWTVENLNSAGTASLIWANDFMGGPGNPAQNFRVTTGPFAAWNIRRNNFNIFQSPGGGGAITNFLNQATYAAFRGVEGPHGGAHVWVGGDMGNAAVAPRDPTFFLLHCNVDRLWSQWIEQHKNDPGFQPYQPAAGGPQGHNLNDTMWPWNGTNNPFGVLPWTVSPELVRPADLVDHRALGYFYDTIDPECQPKLIAKERLPKELLKERPKELLKERKELVKERPKELQPKELQPKEAQPKELAKDRSPKELKDIREGPFVRPEIRPELVGSSLAFESDISDEDLEQLRAELEARAREARLRGPGGPR